MSTPRMVGQPGAVHVWRYDLDVSAAQREALTAHLSPGERERASRLRRPLDRRRWMAARAGLRRLLGECTGIPPAAIEFTTGAHGKPMLAGAGDADLCFSVSHSDAVALYAVARGSEVGVDVERLRDDFPFEEVSARFFTADERRGLAAEHGPDRVGAFYRCWTRKEAALKLSGLGLRGLSRGAQAQPSTTWSLDIAHGYAAAVAVNGVCNSAPVLRRLSLEPAAIAAPSGQPLPLVAQPIR